MMRVPYFDLPGQHQALEPELTDAFHRVLRHGGFILGREVADLEAALAQFLDVEHVVAVSSGTDALVLALRACGVGPGDEVVTVSHSFVATAAAIALVGAKPVFVDICGDTMLMDAEQLPRVLSPRTRAVLPVHLNGFSADLDRIAGFAERHALALVEDCAQAIGAKFKGESVGRRGVGCYSLHPLKILGGCGDGGFVTTRDEAMAGTLREMRNLGLRDRDHCEQVSGNHRLDALQAALLGVKVPHVPGWIDARRAHAEAYRSGLKGYVGLPPDEEDGRAVYSSFVVRHPQRDALLRRVRDAGVDGKIHYPVAIHQQPPYAQSAPALPTTEQVVRQIISLPISEQLSEAQRGYVIDTIRRAVEDLEP